jgi:hypothetical protein
VGHLQFRLGAAGNIAATIDYVFKARATTTFPTTPIWRVSSRLLYGRIRPHTRQQTDDASAPEGIGITRWRSARRSSPVAVTLPMM